MLSLAREIPRADREIRNGNWLKKDLMGIELSGKYLGIVGLGNIGKKLAKHARALNMNIIGYDVIPIPEDFSREVSLIKADLDTLISSADYISFHVPFTESTHHLVNSQLIAKMKKNACIINTSRGEIIDENALYYEIKEGKIACSELVYFEF